MLQRHDVNPRKQVAGVKAYSQKFMQKGFAVDFRSKVIVVPAASNASSSISLSGGAGAGQGPIGEYRVVSGGTLVDAIYQSISNEPSNRFCVKVVQQGLPQVCVSFFCNNLLTCKTN